MYFHLTSCFLNLWKIWSESHRLVYCKNHPCATTPTQCGTQKIVYRGTNLRPQPSPFPNFQLLDSNGLARTLDTEKGKRMRKKKTKASHFSTGPTTSSRHSKNLKLQTVPPPIC